MKIIENGITRDMTAEEIAAMEDAAAHAAAEEKHRPLSLSEVQEMMVRAQINTLAVDDATALRMVAYYPEWTAGTAYAVGDRLVYNGDLYKVLQAHTSQGTWLPGTGTESIYTRIDEQHDGTKYDPIPYNGNMALVSGKYYSQSGVVYLCNRDTGNPVYNALAELVGLYVTEV
nr:MAG TPA: ChiA1-BD-binding domain protein [Caudoviricetes sp.]